MPNELIDCPHCEGEGAVVTDHKGNKKTCPRCLGEKKIREDEGNMIWSNDLEDYYQVGIPYRL